MLIELDRHSAGGFIVKATEGKKSEVLSHIAYEYLEEARRFALSVANRLNCQLINNVTDDVPATNHTKTRALG